MDKKVGFIGSGNMAKSMISGLFASKTVPIENIFVSNKNEESLQNIKNLYNINTLTSNKELSEICDIIFLCVKPYKYKEVCEEIDMSIKNGSIIVSIAPNQTIEKVSSYFSTDIKVMSSMPNTPAKVLAGMSALCTSDKITKEECEEVLEIFKSFGEVQLIDEALMGAVVASAGSSPAFIFMLIEAMADSAVSFGMTRKDAYKFCANAVYGSAKMAIEDNAHVAELKDNVCSPGGTTIKGVLSLEKTGFRTSIQQAMTEVYNKATTM